MSVATANGVLTTEELFNVKQRLSGEPHIPGFEVAVAEVFAR